MATRLRDAQSGHAMYGVIVCDDKDALGGGHGHGHGHGKKKKNLKYPYRIKAAHAAGDPQRVRHPRQAPAAGLARQRRL